MTRRTYAALWSEGDGERPLVGSLQLGPRALTFEGKSPGREALERIRYGDIASFDIDRSTAGRVAGRTALVLVVGRRRIRLGLPETGAMHELAEALTAHSIGGAA